MQSHVVEELQALADLFQNARGDLGLLLGERLGQLSEPRIRRLDRQIAHLADVFAADLDGQRLGFEPVAVARFARM